MSTLYASNFASLQDAINAAAAGDTLVVDSGTYTGDITIDKALTIIGANAGVTGNDGDRNAETNIVGQINITAASGTVTLDGVRVENASANATQQYGVNITGAADVRVQNSIFYSDGPNGGNVGSWGDVAVYMGAGATGHVYVQSNLIDGAAGADHYSNAAWNRGIFAQSDATALTVLNNTINHVRTAIGSQGVSNGDVVERNHISDAGTGLALSYDLSLGHVDKNYFDSVDTEFNFLNATSGVTYNASSPTNTFTNSTGAVILGGDHNDDLTGTAGDDYIAGDASNGNKDGLTFGVGTADNDGNILSGLAGNDTLLGSTGKDSLNGGTGDDVLAGGGGVDTAVYATSVGVDDVTYDATNHVWTVNGGAEGTDKLTHVEVVDGSDAGRILLVDPDGTGFATIQDAVNAAQNGDTIVLAAGTYVEQVTVDGKSDLTIMALPGAEVTIQAPADVHQVATSSSGRAINAVVAVLNGSNVTLDNITIDGAGAGNSVDGSSANFIGVYYRNASGGLENVDITGIHDAYPGGTTVDGFPIQSGNQRGVGLQVDNDSLLSFFMHGGTIADFQKNATVFSRADLDVTGVHITGGGAQTINAQNGIQATLSTGTIDGNTIDHIGYSGTQNVYSGAMLLYGNTDLDITNNTVTGANDATTDAKVVGIFILDFGTANSGGDVSGNIVSYTDEGIDVSGLMGPNGVHIGANDVSHLDLTDVYTAGLYFAPDAGTTDLDVTGTQQNDTIIGAAGNDTFDGQGGNDWIEGGLGNDMLNGGEGDDALTGGAGADDLTGGAGNDTYYGVDGADTVHEDADGGSDTVVTAVSYTLGDNVENLTLIDGPTAVETFEEFSIGAVDNGENGWRTAGSHDQGIVDLGGSHGKVFHMSSDPSSGDFGGPYSTPLTFATGETGTSAAYSSQTISFDFKPVSSDSGDNSRLEVDVGNTSATDRANFMVIETTATGVRVAVAQPDSSGDFGDGGSFPSDWTELVSGLDASVWHHIDLKVQYNDGPDNDVIEVWVDGVMVGTTTTFENYHDSLGGTHDGNAEASLTDALFFRAGNGGQPTDGTGGQNLGFYFDNLSGSNVDGAGNGLNNVITGNSGDNVLTGAGGDDTLNGGDGLDTAHYAADITSADVAYDAANHVWTVSAGAEGTDTLSHVEIVDGANAGRILLVDPDGTGFATIQAAIDAAQAGDTILIAEGVYAEHVNLNKAGITLLGQGEVTLTGTLLSDNNVTGDLHTFMNGATAYTGAAGDGINIAASNVSISNINIEAFLHAVNFGSDVSNVTLTDVDMAHNVIGIEKATTADVDNLTITGGTISDGYIGIDFAKATGVAGIGNGVASNITIDGTAFNDLSAKGIYVETLTDSLITGVSMDNVGQYGGSTSFGANGRTGNGIDLNLKAGTYQGIVIEDFTLNDVGASNGLGTSNINGGAIVIEARSDGGTYGPAPAVVTDTIIVRNGTITGTTSTGIQVGEPGKGNADPDVSVSNVTINGAQHSGTFGDVSNETQSTLTVNGTADGDSVYTSASSTGAIIFDGGAGDDSFTGHNELDTATYGVSLSISDFVYDGGTDSWSVGAGAEGTDTLKGVDKVTDNAGNTYLLVGNGGYASLQAAVNAAAAGDIILVAAGTFTGNVTVDKAVTIVGVNHGVDASGSRVAESIVNGQITVTAASGDVVIDGLYVLNSSSNSVHQDGVAVTGAANVTVENTVLHSGGGNAAFGIGPWGDVAFYVGTGATGHITLDHNLIDGGGTGSFSTASWARAMQTETDASTLTITNNVITGNRSGLGFAGLSASDTVTGNTFNANGTAIAAGLGLDFSGVSGNTLNGNFDDINIRTATGHVSLDLSTFTVTDPGDGYVKVLGSDDNDVLTGSDGNDFLTADASTNSDGLNFGAGSTIVDDNTLYGMGGNDILFGSQGIDTLDGGAGDDTLAGGDGIDVAVYHAPVSASDISFDAGTHTWSVTTAPDGTDSLSKVETVSDGMHRYLLVDPTGDSGFASIQAAVNAAQTGDIIVLAAGTYSGNVTVDKAVTILGANYGVPSSGVRGAESTISGQITVSAAAGNVVVDGVYILNTSDNNTHQDGVDITGAANVTIENSVIHSQGINGNFAQGPWGDVAVYIGTGATGHITLDNNLIDGGGTGSFSTASWSRALQTETDATVLTITNNTITGNRSGLGFAGLSANDTVTGNVLTSNGTAIAAGIDLDLSGVTGNTLNGDFDDFNFRTAYSGVTFDALSQTIPDYGSGYGLVAGVINNVTILGSDFNDNLSGTNGNDFISADASTNSDGLNFGAGSATVDSNTLNGRGGNDVLYGSQGVDTLIGADGNDVMDGGAGNDIMSGGAGDDTYYVDSSTDATSETVGGIDAGGTDLVYASATYTLRSYFENLTLIGNAAITGNGNDLSNIITGNGAANVLRGYAGNDTLDGGAGNDTMLGGAGDDTYIVDSSGDVVHEDTTSGVDDGGHDLVRASATFAIGAFIEDLTLTGTADINGTGNALNNVLTGNSGVNVLRADGGNDIVDGGAGNDIMYGGSGNDTYYVDATADVAREDTIAGIDDGGDDLVLSSASYTLSGFIENLTLTGADDLTGSGNTLNNVLTGNNGGNVLRGMAGNDLVNGGAGADIMFGGSGDDTYIVDNAGDNASEQTVLGIDDGGTDTVISSVSFALGNYIENLNLTGTAAINGLGNAWNNVISGNSAVNVIRAYGGNDVLDGGAGADKLFGGAGDDTYYVDNVGDLANEQTVNGIDDGGNDTVFASVTYTLGSFLENLTLTGNANIWGIGNDLNNTLVGNSGANNLAGRDGNDIIDGGAGADRMVGGAGDDTYYVDNTGDITLEQSTGNVDTGGIDQVYASVSYALSVFVENLTLTGSTNIDATGNASDNILVGNSGNNVLNGGAGRDFLTGGGGADTFVASKGPDYITDFNSGENDMIDVSAFTHGVVKTNLIFQNGADVVINFGGANILTIQNATYNDPNLLSHIHW